ncbi:tRNA (N6-threonylcarbamoyladenosine(37)-N6)-methyltransferase TrmO [Pseudodesulfovibrio methanolicus]|uniref:tRNA (N6-threonylcarbamoyladenosine(37)-N6)-methyltransferase TrmO n=1 Tax=Pseudodesulfovibrio methanolicus TaxID=3126690 RepID=A0ABZ2IXZ1_9BACT
MDKELVIIGTVQSEIKDIESAPKMETEAGAVRARIVMDPAYAEAMDGLEPGDRLELFTWFHKSDRTVLKVHPRGIKDRPLRGVFATRSPARPNPIGLHRVTLVAIEEPLTLVVEPLEAIDGTPIIDIKPKPREK